MPQHTTLTLSLCNLSDARVMEKESISNCIKQISDYIISIGGQVNINIQPEKVSSWTLSLCHLSDARVMEKESILKCIKHIGDYIISIGGQVNIDIQPEKVSPWTLKSFSDADEWDRFISEFSKIK